MIYMYLMEFEIVVGLCYFWNIRKSLLLHIAILCYRIYSTNSIPYIKIFKRRSRCKDIKESPIAKAYRDCLISTPVIVEQQEFSYNV